MSPFPIVLAHGIARFDMLQKILMAKFPTLNAEFGDRFHYFKGIKSHLEAHGFEVHHTSVDFAGSVGKRAGQLGEQVRQIVGGRDIKVHIIAHSMGGLDARQMIVDSDEIAQKVASLTSIGTPHLGTTLADFVLDLGGHLLIKNLSDILDLTGFADLTTEACQKFNDRAHDKEASNDVVYRTYASAEDRASVLFLLQPSWLIINNREGENDGLVSIKSQQWVSELVGSGGQRKTIEQHRFPVPADHLNEVGWWDPQESSLLDTFFESENQIREYENKIKDVYLQIAKNL